jgi:mannose-6-phosphate isomerase-like protein (cupin superfamily)
VDRGDADDARDHEEWQASAVATEAGSNEATRHHVGDLAEVLDNLGVFGMLAEDLVAPCPSGFRRVPISQGSDYYLSIQGFTPNQIAYAHTHPDSEEWVMVLRGNGEALVAENPVALGPGLIIGRAAAHPHGFLSGDQALQLLSVQLPRPSEGTTTWDQSGETTDPIDCTVAGTCRRCWRCGGHSLNVRGHVFLCENCNLAF